MTIESVDQSDLLDELQNWYQKHCDGDWEHQGGITIKTLDNPGWIIIIDLNCVPPWGYEKDLVFSESTDEDQLDIRYISSSNTLEAFCVPQDLKRALSKVIALLKTGV